jgi:hypothetical protein
VTSALSRARLVSRIEIEARAYRNADYTTKAIGCLGSWRPAALLMSGLDVPPRLVF